MIEVWILWPLWLLLGALALIAWLSIRLRLHRMSNQPGPTVDDDDVRQIVEEGRITSPEDDPLDMEEVKRKERAFWDEERWDEAGEV